MDFNKEEPLGKGRTVPMQVLVIGLPRTGTRSMMMALQQLGYHEVFHMPAGLEPGSHEPVMWVRAMDAKFEGKGKLFEKEDWDCLLGRYMAVTDAPPALFAHELMAAYPDAKVILTTRATPLLWAQSLNTVCGAFARIVYDRGSLLANIWLWLSPSTGQTLVMRRLLKYTSYANLGTGPDAQNYYWDHNNGIRRSCADRGRDLLEFRVEEGWGPLCRFLGKSVPEGEFPRSNERELMEGKLALLRKQMDEGARRNVLKYFGAIGVLGMAVLWGRKADVGGWGRLLRA